LKSVFWLANDVPNRIAPDPFGLIGIGLPQPRFNFLQQLAAENGGQHTYLDVTRLGR